MLQAGVKSPPISPLCPPPVQTVRILYHGAVSAGDAAALAHEIIQASKGERCHPENPEGNRHVSRSPRSEEHTSELQSLMRISYAVFCLKKKNETQQQNLKQS